LKVYTVHGHYDYEGNEILGVYDSKEKAKQKQKQLEEERKKVILGYDGYYIEEHEVE
jgi:hypothetical protein